MTEFNQFTDTGFDAYTSTGFNVWDGLTVPTISPVLITYGIRKFFCTLTGSQDGTTDIQIPIYSFQGRRRSGNPTYLSVVTHDTTYADEIAARPNGEIYVEMGYDLGGTIYDRTEIIRGALDTIVYDEGGKSQAITLSGHKTESWVGKAINLEGATYKRTTNSAFTYRLSDINVLVKPGDSVTVNGDTFNPSAINFFVAATKNGVNAQMELTE